MSKYAYRISTDTNWTSNFGFAYIALVNTSGSGRKITIRSVEVNAENLQSTSTSAVKATLYKNSSVHLAGEDITAWSTSRADTETALPSGLKVLLNAISPGYSTQVGAVDLGRRTQAGGNFHRNLFGEPMSIGSRKARTGGYRCPAFYGSSAVEAITLAQNESITLVADQTLFAVSNPRRFSIMLSVAGKLLVSTFVANTRPGMGIFGIENTNTTPVEIISISYAELGSLDTPTLKLVPIGQLYGTDVGDTSKQSINITKMDTTYPDLNANFKLFADIGFIPFGVPEVAIAQASAGSPKGLNYLHTKDFDGPVYRNILTECDNMRVGGFPDSFGTSSSHHYSDILARRAGIVVNPGEGIAIVNSAETAVGVTTAYSGWPQLNLAFQIDDEPSKVPVISITGMVDGSIWRIEKVSDNSMVGQGTAGVAGTGSVTYTDEDTPVNLRIKVRKGSSAPYYKPYETTFSLTIDGISIPVSQVSDT